MIKFAVLVFSSILIGAAPVMAQQPPTPVFVTDAIKKEFVDEIQALGTLQANENVDLTSSVTERITTINFESGQRVKQGDLLVEMDSSEEQALLAEEKSVLAEAERQVERLRPLIKRGAASQSTMDAAELEALTSRSRINAIETQINERRIVAPFDGKLGLRNVSVGVMAQPGTLITTIDDDSIMKLDFSVPEIFLPSLKEGGKINATAKAFEGEVFEGVIQSIDSRVDPVSRAVVVRALLKNDEAKLRPGMLMRVQLFKNPRTVIVIPEETLVPRGDKNFVFIVRQEDGKSIVSLTPIEMGARRKGEVEVLGGIEEGDMIVTHGALRVQDGGAVIINAKDNGNPPLEEMLQQKNQNNSEE